MRKIYSLITIFFILSQLHVNAQSYSVSGVQTVFSLPANSTSKFKFFSFATGDTIPRTDSITTTWDIAFRGTTIILNGGTSGPGTVTGQVVIGGTFANTSSLPVSGYVSDGTTKAIPTGSGNGWYNYNSTTHIISPLPQRVIAIKLANGDYVKLEVLSYYDGAPLIHGGTSGYYTFRYHVTSDNDFSDMLTHVSNLKANGSHYQFFRLGEADTLIVADSATTKWDIAFRNTTILLNSGDSGPDNDSAQVVAFDFDDCSSAPLTGWKADNNTTGKAIPTGSNNGWYNYNPSTHVISPLAAKTILVKLKSGRYAKIEIESYYVDGITTNTSGYYTFSYFLQTDGTQDLESDVASTTGITDTEKSDFIKVYPNPASEHVTINIQPLSEATYVIVDARGTVIAQGGINGEKNISVNTLTPGLYLLHVQSEGKEYSQKLIVK